jgi:hypothetical protein
VGYVPYTSSPLGTRTIYEHVLKLKTLDAIGVRGFFILVNLLKFQI